MTREYAGVNMNAVDWAESFFLFCAGVAVLACGVVLVLEVLNMV